MASTLALLKKSGCWVVGLDAAASDSIFSMDLTAPVSIVIGGEQKGIRPLVKKQCDHLALIPQSGIIDSLNASAAGAVAMYEVYRQRLVSGR
jgi:23S rRNA (guanosine2251-2'-O)-methyltransferase